MAASLIALVLSCFEITSATLSYRSDGPNVEYKSLRDLERTPFLLGDGSWYRDRLTIEASKAVGQFAQNHHFQPYSQPYFEYPEVIHNHHFNQIPSQYSYGASPPPTPSYNHHHLNRPHLAFNTHTTKPFATSSDYYSDSIDYGKAQFIHIPQDLEDQRAIADKEEYNIIQAAKLEENQPQSPATFPSRNPFSFPSTSSSAFASKTRSSYPQFRNPPPPTTALPRRQNYIRHDFFSTPRKTPLVAPSSTYYYG